MGPVGPIGPIGPATYSAPIGPVTFSATQRQRWQRAMNLSRAINRHHEVAAGAAGRQAAQFNQFG